MPCFNVVTVFVTSKTKSACAPTSRGLRSSSCCIEPMLLEGRPLAFKVVITWMKLSWFMANIRFQKICLRITAFKPNGLAPSNPGLAECNEATQGLYVMTIKPQRGFGGF